MRSKKFVLLVVFIVLLLTQIPFAYRRFKLRRLNAAVQQLNSQRTQQQTNGFTEYKGVIHVHSFLGGHSSGTFSEIISAAQANQLQFVIMTEHTEKDFDTAAMTLQGVHGGVIFIDLSAVTQAAIAVPAIAQALGLREHAGQDQQAQIVRFLRTKELLLVLDNVEQIIDAAPEIGRALAQALLA